MIIEQVTGGFAIRTDQGIIATVTQRDDHPSRPGISWEEAQRRAELIVTALTDQKP